MSENPGSVYRMTNLAARHSKAGVKTFATQVPQYANAVPMSTLQFSLPYLLVLATYTMISMHIKVITLEYQVIV